jgi:hypothetical protein
MDHLITRPASHFVSEYQAMIWYLDIDKTGHLISEIVTKLDHLIYKEIFCCIKIGLA